MLLLGCSRLEISEIIHTLKSGHILIETDVDERINMVKRFSFEERHVRAWQQVVVEKEQTSRKLKYKITDHSVCN